MRSIKELGDWRKNYPYNYVRDVKYGETFTLSQTGKDTHYLKVVAPLEINGVLYNCLNLETYQAFNIAEDTEIYLKDTYHEHTFNTGGVLRIKGFSNTRYGDCFILGSLLADTCCMLVDLEDEPYLLDLSTRSIKAINPNIVYYKTYGCQVFFKHELDYRCALPTRKVEFNENI